MAEIAANINTTSNTDEYKTNTYSIDELISIRDNIDVLTKFNQIEVLRILYKEQKNMLNENKYGVHINLTELPSNIINKLKLYLNYVNTQEITLDEIQKQQDDLKNMFMIKDNKDNI